MISYEAGQNVPSSKSKCIFTIFNDVGILFNSTFLLLLIFLRIIIIIFTR